MCSRLFSSYRLITGFQSLSKKSFVSTGGSRKFCGAMSLAQSVVTVESPSLDSTHLIWLDLELTGLNVDVDKIIEAACIITDKDANIIAESPNFVIHQPLNILDSMNPWCKEHHSKSGLYDASLASNFSLEKVEDELVTFVRKHSPPGVCSLAGNSVYMDKFFLMKYMPRFCQHLHYRIVDVSTIKTLARNWYQLAAPNKVFAHRASDDIKESIEELKYYRQVIFRPELPTDENKG